MLVRMIERVRRATSLDAVVVATSTDASDDDIASICDERKIDCERGSLDDVLDRFYRVAERRQPGHIVRLTGDCPLIDPAVIDEVVGFALDGGYDYASNTLEPTFPDGLDVEVCTFNALQEAWRRSRLPSEREHVTPFIKTNSTFRLGNYRLPHDYSAHRWTVDEPEDLALVTRIYEALMPDGPNFGMAEVIDFVTLHPEIAVLNAQFGRDEGYARSVAKDLAFKGSR
tara:strand:+ start:42280 stop:42963 length:684 start_codon:yes stop_codon:yes gene_type:complete